MFTIDMPTSNFSIVNSLRKRCTFAVVLLREVLVLGQGLSRNRWKAHGVSKTFFYASRIKFRAAINLNCRRKKCSTHWPHPCYYEILYREKVVSLIKMNFQSNKLRNDLTSVRF